MNDKNTEAQTNAWLAKVIVFKAVAVATKAIRSV